MQPPLALRSLRRGEPEPGVKRGPQRPLPAGKSRTGNPAADTPIPQSIIIEMKGMKHPYYGKHV